MQDERDGIDDLPRDIPLFIARAGHDRMPGLNDALDRFVVKALACNLPVTFVNHAMAPHAFDLIDDTEASREVIRQMPGVPAVSSLDNAVTEP